MAELGAPDEPVGDDEHLKAFIDGPMRAGLQVLREFCPMQVDL